MPREANIFYVLLVLPVGAALTNFNVACLLKTIFERQIMEAKETAINLQL
jgi:hypothetical protein